MASGRPHRAVCSPLGVLAETDPAVIADRVRVALGEAPPDLLVRGGTVVNVYTGELHPGWDVAVRGAWIAYAGPAGAVTAGPETEVVDAAGAYVAPGYVDGHVHWGYLARLDEYVRHALALGATTVVSETTDVAHALGLRGVQAFLAAAARLPCRVLAAAPQPFTLEVFGVTPPLSEAEVAGLLARPGVITLGEVYWPLVTAGHRQVLRLVAASLARGLQLQGHGAGARGPKLQAFLAAGLTSDHEPITAEEALDRLRLGCTVLVRQGSIRRDLPAVAAVRRAGVGLGLLGVASDGVWPTHLLELGHMDWVLRSAVEAGFPPVEAIRMATRVPAAYFGLDAVLGGVAPGRLADLLVLPDLAGFRPRVVIAGGRVVAREGELTVQVPATAYPRSPLRLARAGGPEAYRLPAAAGPRPGVRLVTELVTEPFWAEAEDTAAGVNLAAAFDRHSDRVGLAPVAGYGLKAGAIAAATGWDGCVPVVVAADPEAMAAAVRAMQEGGGAAVVIRDGQVLARLPMPHGGAISDRPLPEVARGLREWEAAARSLGCPLERPFLALSTLTFTAVPAVRLSPRGVVDVRRQALVAAPAP